MVIAVDLIKCLNRIESAVHIGKFPCDELRGDAEKVHDCMLCKTCIVMLEKHGTT